jgi:subtilase family serine protease
VQVAVTEYTEEEDENRQDDDSNRQAEVRVDGAEGLSTGNGSRDAIANLADGVDEGEEAGTTVESNIELKPADRKGGKRGRTGNLQRNE